MLIECHECGSKVSTEAAVCMTCGAPPVVTATHSQAFIKKQQQRLLDLRDELVASMSGTTHDGIHNSTDGSEVSRSGQHQGDAASDTYDRDFALSMLAREQNALQEIEQALHRIDAGTYGICEISSNKIPQARLEAIPFARLTVDCQTKLEREYGARVPQNYQQTAPPLPPVKAQSLAPQQPNHHAPHHNPDEKIVLVNSVSQWPQETTNQNTKQVSFGTARYRVVCPQCKEIYRVSGKSLGSKENVKCPNKACGWSAPTKGISLVQVDGELVVYSRIKDYFSYNGRISVGDYWLSLLVALPVMLLVKVLLSPLYPLILFVMLHPLWIKRYHDHGMRSEWVFIQAIASVTSTVMIQLIPSVIYEGKSYPIFGLVHGLALLTAIGTGVLISLIPSKKGLNRYGPPTSNVKKVWN
jgi:RNA polymerase-binding protein DksA